MQEEVSSEASDPLGLPPCKVLRALPSRGGRGGSAFSPLAVWGGSTGPAKQCQQDTVRAVSRVSHPEVTFLDYCLLTGWPQFPHLQNGKQLA